jgi:hypothetical protein
VSRLPNVNNQYPHVGMAAYFVRPVSEAHDLAERVAQLLVDRRWPWIPWYAEFVGVHKRDDTASVRVGGKNGYAPLLGGITSPRFQKLRMNRARGDKDFTSVNLPFHAHRLEWGYEAPYDLWITCRSAELPEGKTFDNWGSLAHDLVTAVGAVNATIGSWPTYDHAVRDTWLTRMVLDTPKGDIALNDLPEDFESQIDLLQRWRKRLGRTYARHPRWGTYLNATHVAAIGGVERIRAEVQPARIDPVGDLTYIQLTDSIETGMSPQAGARRRKLQALMEPILLGAGQPPRPADG